MSSSLDEHEKTLDHSAWIGTQLEADAMAATQKEKDMTLMEGLRTYPKACLWSMLISSCIIMEGYDVVLINGLCEFMPLGRMRRCRWPTTLILPSLLLSFRRRLSTICKTVW